MQRSEKSIYPNLWIASIPVDKWGKDPQEADIKQEGA